MAFQIKLMRYTGENNRINKSLYIAGEYVLEGNLKEDTSIINPVILIQKTTPIPNGLYNYMYIGAFGRYYFIDDIKSIHNSMWEISAKVDVLYTYREDILNSKCIIDKSEGFATANVYLNDGSFVMDSRKYNEVLQFPSGLSEQGNNILICSGG